MTPSLFKRYWEERYACLPFGHYLRQMYESRWFRIHTLPDSKRYAETESEYAEILRRHNVMLDDLLEAGQTYVLVTTNWSESLASVNAQPEVEELVGQTDIFLGNQLPPDEDPDTYWHFFMSALIWKTNSLDKLLRLVADDEIRDVLIVNPQSGIIYHPYDGGADVILVDAADVEFKKWHYANWLSRHPAGL